MSATERLKSALSDRYVIDRELGSGGMATVYLARDLKHDRDVALKVLRQDLSAVIGTERFLSEVKISAKLDHPHILTLIDSGEADGMLYYVLPYVRGESLRAKLEREKQLGIDEALSITKQVASALDYAHERGVVHRDIKPENILLHEGEAVLADFGIALAVKEAGGNRLTETGLSLGTPQYMSPEQATGDRALDRRSDIYSLGAVFYEMISGEPPVTGATAQVMIAKLLTERPVKLRVMRETVPVSMELAAEKALAKVPADRFSSAGEFARALAAATPSAEKPSGSKSTVMWIAGAAVVAILAAAFVLSKGRGREDGAGRVALRERVQVTNTGNVSVPTISDDGKTLGYVVTICGAGGCRYGVEVRDVAGGPSRRIVEGASGIYRVEISPDRRNVGMIASIDGMFGYFIVSMFGGKPRHIVNGYASFYAGGDSLLISRFRPPSDSYWLVIAGLDGTPADSIRVDAGGERPPFFVAVPGGKRIAYHVRDEGVLQVGVIERDGKSISTFRLSPGDEGGITAASDALWLYVTSQGSNTGRIIRVALDSSTGKPRLPGDTISSARVTGMSITADGSLLVYDEGSTDYSGWAMSVDDVIQNRFTEEKRVFRTTGSARGSISPDGKIVVIGRDRPSGGREFSVIPFGTTAETPIPGVHRSAHPLDSATVKVVDVVAGGTVTWLYDLRTRRRSAERTMKDVGVRDVTRVGRDTWAWIPPDGRVVRIQRDHESRPRDIRLPSWYKDVIWLAGSADGRRLVFTGWQAPAEDSVGVGLLTLPENTFTQLYVAYGEGAAGWMLDDGSVAVVINDTPQSQTLYRVKSGAPAERIGSTPKLIPSYSIWTVSTDLKRAFLVTIDDRRDIWTSKVVR
jgi:hypothetical protein